VEGKLRDYQVLGQDEFPQRPILLSKDKRGAFWVSAGALHGFSVGTVFAVHPPEGSADPDDVLGYVCVPEKGLRVLDARVEPYEFDAKEGAVAPSKLPRAARCKPVSINLGDQRLRVAVDVPKGNETLRKQALRLQKALSDEAESATSTFQVVSDPIAERPEWFVLVEEEGVFLVQASGLATQEGTSGREDENWFGPAPDSEKVDDWLKRSLEHIARVAILKQLAAKFQAGKLGGGQRIKLEAEMLVRATEADDWKKLSSEANEMPVMTEGQLFTFDLHNRGSHPTDVSILFVDADYGIEQYYPEPGLQLDNRLPSGKTVRTEEAEMAAETVGVEQMIVIAVKSKAQGQPMDFSALRQLGLSRAERNVSAKSLDEQLDLLFPDDDPGKRMRSFRRRDIEEIQFQVFTFRTQR